MGILKSLILVMIMLHNLQGLRKNNSRLTDVMKEITGKMSGSLAKCISRKMEKLY